MHNVYKTTKLQMLYVNLQFPICGMLVQLLEIYEGYSKRNII